MSVNEFTTTTTASVHMTVFIGVKLQSVLNLSYSGDLTGMQPQQQQSMCGPTAR